MVGGDIVSAVELRPAQVIADGRSTVDILIKNENKLAKRNTRNTGTLRPISASASQTYQGNDGLKQVHASGEAIRVCGPANQSIGGTVHDADHLITKVIKEHAEKLARFLHAPVIGLDCLLEESGEHYFLEINASPGLGIHNDEYWGTNADSYGQYARWLYKH